MCGSLVRCIRLVFILNCSASYGLDPTSRATDTKNIASAGLPDDRPVQSVSQLQQLPPNWLDKLTIKIKRSHMEDLTLAQTPKGTGAGYGLGVDIDAILREAAAKDPKEAER